MDTSIYVPAPAACQQPGARVSDRTAERVASKKRTEPETGLTDASSAKQSKSDGKSPQDGPVMPVSDGAAGGAAAPEDFIFRCEIDWHVPQASMPRSRSPSPTPLSRSISPPKARCNSPVEGLD